MRTPLQTVPETLTADHAAPVKANKVSTEGYGRLKGQGWAGQSGVYAGGCAVGLISVKGTEKGEDVLEKTEECRLVDEAMGVVGCGRIACYFQTLIGIRRTDTALMQF